MRQLITSGRLRPAWGLLGTLLLVLSAPLSPGRLARVGKVAVLDDFESPKSLQNWRGQMALSRNHPSHGRQSLKVTLFPSRLVSENLPKDWSEYDRLLLDIYSPERAPITLSVGVYDELADDATAQAKDEAFLPERGVYLIPGMNHIEVKLGGLEVSASTRKLALNKVRRFDITPGSLEHPVEVYVDNLRLVQGAEDAATASTASTRRPEDGTVVLGSRSAAVGQVGPREAVAESASVKLKRQQARQELKRLEETIEAARMMGLETIYQEIPLVTAELGLDVRPLLSWFNNDSAKSEMFDFVAASCRAARLDLEARISGARRLPNTDDTQVAGLSVPPYPPLKGLKVKDGFFVNAKGEPLLILSLHSPSVKLTRFFATPQQHIESYTAGGGSRWTIEDSPVFEAFEKYPDTHRVGWDGWCGHLIRDRWSDGGGRGEVVTCLESTHIRQAIEQYIQREAPRWMNNPDLLYNIMGYELQYICYCDRSQEMFRDWLRQRHQSIEQVNIYWNTKYKSFDEVTAPPVRDAIPLPGTNRAQWYDWACFNQERFTNHLAWVKSAMRKIDPDTPITSGGSSSMLVGSNGTSGIDEELLINKVNDIALHEGGGSTLGADLEWALAERKLPLADPELSGSVRDVLPQFLHGKSVMQLYHWPPQPGAGFPYGPDATIPFGWRWPLSDVAELLRIALDIRRLNREIVAFASVRPEVATLYSKTSVIQIPPELMSATSTPYLEELRRMYEGSLYLDTGTTFISETQILKGLASQYKVILVPAAKHLPPEVAQALLDYVREGGHVVISPESFASDQYLRPLDFLKKVGIGILQTSVAPEIQLGALQQQYDQTLGRSIVSSGSVNSEITMLPGSESGDAPLKLKGRGIVQTLTLENGSIELARFEDGRPAIAKHTLGQGSVYYLATPLEPESYARLLDRIFGRAGVSRPVRVTDGVGKRIWQIEARSLSRGRGWLLYVVNHSGAAVEIRLSFPATARSLRDLRRDEALLPGNLIPLASGETRLLEAD